MNTDRFKYRAYIKSLNLLVELKWYCFEPNGGISLITAEGRMMNLRQDDVTLEQCLGKPDRNKKLIYEKDRIRYDDTPYNAYASVLTGVIVWDWKINGFGILKSDSVLGEHICSIPRDDFFSRKTEIIGNIHESEANNA